MPAFYMGIFPYSNARIIYHVRFFFRTSHSHPDGIAVKLFQDKTRAIKWGKYG
jgi:hypothetical protein